MRTIRFIRQPQVIAFIVLNFILFNLVNNCASDVQIHNIDLAWTNFVAEKRLEHMCYDVPGDVDPEDCEPVLDFVPPQISPVTPVVVTSVKGSTAPGE